MTWVLAQEISQSPFSGILLEILSLVLMAWLYRVVGKLKGEVQRGEDVREFLNHASESVLEREAACARREAELGIQKKDNHTG